MAFGGSPSANNPRALSLPPILYPSQREVVKIILLPLGETRPKRAWLPSCDEATLSQKEALDSPKPTGRTWLN